MTKFLFTTQSTRTTTYDGPSGTRYIININLPFKVKNPKDIEAFRKNHRFKEIGLLTPKPEPTTPDVDEQLSKELKKIRGLSARTRKKVVDLYFSIEHLTDVIEQKYKLDPKIPRTHRKRLKDYFTKKARG